MPNAVEKALCNLSIHSFVELCPFVTNRLGIETFDKRVCCARHCGISEMTPETNV